MGNNLLYNSSNLIVFIEYVSKNYPEVNISEVLEYASITKSEIYDAGQWFNQDQTDRFYEILVKKTGNNNLAREAGHYITEAKNAAILRQYAAGFITPSIAYWMLGKIASTISRHLTMAVRSVTSNKVEITVTVNEDVTEKPYQCENRIGLFESLALLFTGKYGQIEHIECIHKGYPYCKYTVTWERTFSNIWKMVTNYLSILGLVLTVGLFFLMPIKSWIIFLFIFTSISLAGFLTSERLAKGDLIKSVESQRSAAEQIINQFTIRYNEIALIKEISEAASSILESHKLLDFITNALQKRLQFNRGMIMLANPERTKLIYTTGYGYTTEEEALLKNTGFTLTNPNSEGIFYLVYRDMKPYLINDTDDIKNKLSVKSAQFMQALKVKTFICVPITYEGKSEGILAVDGTQSERPLTESDLSLLMGIAPQIGISLNNALAHKRLTESEERFRNLSNNSPDIIYQLDEEGKFKYVNPAWEKVFGQSIGSLSGEHLTDFTNIEGRASIDSILKSIIADSATVRDSNIILLDKDEKPHHVAFTGAPDLDAEGNVIGVVGTLKDITKLRNMEAQLLHASKMEAVGTLTGGVAHDFNNIIQGILGNSQLIMAKRIGNEADVIYLKNIEELIARSRELVKQLMLFSRKVEPQSKVVDINTEIVSTQKLLQKSIPKMIEIHNNLDENISLINADATQIGQVIMNLMLNACDAMVDSGSINITTQNTSWAEDTYTNDLTIPAGDYVNLSISDTGSGMRKEVMQHIFEPFFTTKEVGKGTGLGLAVVYGIVKSHNGFIYCQSELEKGTTFNILFPAVTTTDPQEIAEPSQHQQIQTGTETILLVDDEKSILETGQETLSFYGYKILTAGNGEQAIEIYKVQKDNIQLVILDLNMPGKGGKVCLSELIAINPQVKVLITSGYSSSQQIAELINTGATEFISKPYHQDDLLIAIRKSIDKA
ncbi:MAG: hypothetical protein CVU54_00525 [Deltaproteobacteria bacterium HGW-Deltaproteobacteria-12]|jgi:PAS domain S-box-containing protein|nr:MAG: hypothetical protein CVU54_00525 [Deltaproteobacteria bacterium HGW-Deltaproteobacteria-12]